MSSDPSSVHPKETSAAPGPRLTYRAELLRFDSEELLAVEQTYSLFKPPSESSILQRLDDCRTAAYFCVNDQTRTVAVLSSSCKLRWCPMCAKARSACITASATDWLNRCMSPKLMTLTFKHSNAPLSHQLNYLYSAFRQLRQRKYFASRVRGGIWFFQITFSQETHQWHLHLHTLIDAEFIPQKALSRIWLEVTGHSPIVDIRQVRNRSEAAKYVARYAARPALLSKLPYEARLPLMESLHARRIVGTWGSARLVSLRPQNASESGPWSTIGSYSDMIESAKSDALSLKCLTAWRQRSTLSEGDVAALMRRRYPPYICASALDSPPDPQYTFADLHPPPAL